MYHTRSRSRLNELENKRTSVRLIFKNEKKARKKRVTTEAENERKTFYQNDEWVKSCRDHISIENNVKIPNMHDQIPRDFQGYGRFWSASSLFPRVPDIYIVPHCGHFGPVVIEKQDNGQYSAHWSLPAYGQQFLQNQSWFPVSILGKFLHHANIMWINHRRKTLELFDPFGYRDAKDAFRCSQFIYGTFLKRLPNYKVLEISYPQYNSRRDGPQYFTNDSNCVYWCQLFVHLKFINPRRTSSDIWYSWFSALVAQYGIKWKRALRTFIQRYRFVCFNAEKIYPKTLIKSFL